MSLISATAVFVACLASARSAGASEAPTCEAGAEGCGTPSSSMLQARSVRGRIAMATGLERYGLVEDMYSYHGLIAGAKLTIHKTSKVAHDPTATDTFLLSRQDGCNDEDVHRWRANVAREHDAGPSKNATGAPAFEGRPSRGGLCLAVASGTLAELEKALGEEERTRDMVVETDGILMAIPEVEALDLGASEGEVAATWGRRRRRRRRSQPVQQVPWGLDRIDDRSGLDNSYVPEFTGQGAGAHVYVLDTGIRCTHKDFGGRAIPTLESLGSLKVCGANDMSCADDTHGHGTHCAGTVAGAKYGVAKKATVHAVQVLSDDGPGKFSWFLEALDWVMVNGESPKIVSASLGGKGKSSNIHNAIEAAVKAGTVVVVAAGNSDEDSCNDIPASAPFAITVGAMDKSDARSSFSNYGTCNDIFAPGSGILSAAHTSDTGERTISGTSMACPHVAGAAALVLGANSDTSAADVSTILTSKSSKNKITDIKGSSNYLLHV